MPDAVRTIGILGAGKVGLVLARLAARAGYKVLIAGSGDPSAIALTVEVLAPAAEPTARDTLIAGSDVVILAFPLSRLNRIPRGALAGKVTIDAMNYWAEVDGVREYLLDLTTTTSQTVQSYLEGSRLVKALNHVGYHDLDESALPSGTAARIGIAIAGDDRAAVHTVEAIIDALGFDPVQAGPLAEGIRFEPRSELFGAKLPAADVVRALKRFDDSEHGRRVADARRNAFQAPAEAA